MISKGENEKKGIKFRESIVNIHTYITLFPFRF